jgi:ADP-ribose pyrophosphatase YjhB (NUDIX family)
LIQRGKEPNKGIWSFPGGKVEVGESSINAAKRELWEETRLTEECNSPRLWSLRFFEDGPVTSTDSIIQRADSGIAFHYVITQWFAQIIIHDTTKLEATDTSLLFPNLIASDDAANAKWWSNDEIIQGISSGQITKGVDKVIHRSELLYQKGLL